MSPHGHPLPPPAYVQAARLIANGRYHEADATFDRAAYRAEWKLPFMVVFGFVHRFAVREFRLTGGDRLMAMVAGEIWLHNAAREALAAQGVDEEDTPYVRCNTYSIAQYLGISNATCRRKVRKLMDMGWVEMNARKQLTITKACEDVFNRAANEESMADFISTARGLFRALSLPLEPPPPDR